MFVILDLISDYFNKAPSVPIEDEDYYWLHVKEPKKLPQAIVNDKTTILIDNEGKKYFSKPEKGEKFDLEKGILVCLAKMAGFSTTDILEIVKNAKIQDKQKGKSHKTAKR